MPCPQNPRGSARYFIGECTRTWSGPLVETRAGLSNILLGTQSSLEAALPCSQCVCGIDIRYECPAVAGETGGRCGLDNLHRLLPTGCLQ